jgi:putative transcriptional regulator
MTDEAATPLRAGQLLVATPALVDPNFEHTVVLLLDIDDDGALGVVLNRPSGVPVGEVLPEWSDAAAVPDVLFAGGPVGTDSALAVGALPEVAVAGSRPGDGGPVEEAEPVGFRRLYGDVGIVDLDTPTELLASALTGLRLFAGYAGWSREQLVAEIEEESWYVVPSLPGDLFGADPEKLWARVLRRQPGELAWVSTRPVDPTLN